MAVVSMMKMSGDAEELAAKLPTTSARRPRASRPGTAASAAHLQDRTTESW